MAPRLRIYMNNSKGEKKEYSTVVVARHMQDAGFKPHQAKEAAAYLETLHSTHPSGVYPNGLRKFEFVVEDDSCDSTETQSE